MISKSYDYNFKDDLYFWFCMIVDDVGTLSKHYTYSPGQNDSTRVLFLISQKLLRIFEM